MSDNEDDGLEVGQQRRWDNDADDDKLKRLFRKGAVQSKDREFLIKFARKHFPETIGTDKPSIDNRVKHLRRKICEFDIGIAKEGARKSGQSTI